MHAVDLVSGCARDTGDSDLWTEFLRRYGPKIKQFIRGTLRAAMRSPSLYSRSPAPLGAVQESDLFQNTIVRLVERDCAAIRRFSGMTEGDWLAYLAVVTRSVVRDYLRRQRAQKRPFSRTESLNLFPPPDSGVPYEAEIRDPEQTERQVLGRELAGLYEQAIQNLGSSAARDKLIYQLYFFHDLSINQISRCEGVNLSKAGVEKTLNRLKDRVRTAATAGPREEMLR